MTVTLLPHRAIVRRGIAPAAVLLAGIVGYSVHAARAGIPTTNALVYSGTLTNGSGAPLTGEHSVQIGVFDSESGGSAVCPLAVNATLTPDPSGAFRMQLDDACAADVEQNTDLWLEVTVDGTPLARSKLGAVPYAIEAKNAQHAANADLATEAETAAEADNAALLGGLQASDFADVSHDHAFSSLTGIPSGLSDGDNDTTYTNGTGILLSGTTFSADTAYMQRRANGMSTTCSGTNQAIKTIAADGTVTCETDDNTAYSAGSGLALTSTTFSVRAADYYTVTSAGATDQTVTTNGPRAFCGLGRVRLLGYDDAASYRQCVLAPNTDSTWTLYANAGVASGQQIRCDMYCF